MYVPTCAIYTHIFLISRAAAGKGQRRGEELAEFPPTQPAGQADAPDYKRVSLMVLLEYHEWVMEKALISLVATGLRE